MSNIVSETALINLNISSKTFSTFKRLFQSMSSGCLKILFFAGKELNIQQKDVQLNGWAIESRVYAEVGSSYLVEIICFA